MATYKEIQTYIKGKFGFTPKTCWIAHMKEVYGLDRKDAVNRMEPDKRKYPCPIDKQECIKEAFEYFGMM